MSVTIERVRRCVKNSTGGYTVFCKDLEILVNKRYINGEFVVLINSGNPRIEKIRSIFDKVEDGRKFNIGDDVSDLVPEDLIKVYKIV
jgi:hypothetical protein